MLRLDPDPTKTKVQTRDGRDAEIYAVKEGQEQPIIGACNCDGTWHPFVWGSDGSFFLKHCALGSANDLVNAPAPEGTKDVWAVMHRDDTVIVWYSEPTQRDISFLGLKGSKRLTISVTPGVYE